MRKVTLLSVLALTLAAGACSPANDSIDVADPTPAPEATPECAELVETSLQVLSTRITRGDATLNIQSIKATNDLPQDAFDEIFEGEVEEYWFVGGEITGGEPAGFALWITVEDPADRIVNTFYAANDIAIQGSDWPPSPGLDDDPSVEVLTDCVMERA